MENNFNNKEFEQFLNQNANKYRMYPSEKVWKGIYSSLHSRRRWFLFGLMLLALAAATAIWVILSTPATQKLSLTVPEKNDYSLNNYETNPVSEINNPSIQKNKQLGTLIPLLHNNQQEASSNVTDDVIPLVTSANFNNIETILPSNSDKVLSTTTNPLDTYTESINKNPLYYFNINDLSIDNNLDLTGGTKVVAPGENEVKKEIKKNIYPLSIETVLNSYQAITKKNITLQAYFAPTISYRKLSGNNAALNSAAANNSPTNSLANLYNVSKVVTHKPSIGLELGLSARYPITKNIKVKAGLQFNISRYDIKAFNFAREIAIITLNQGSGISSVSTWTKYRNFNGYSSNWLENYYFSVSTPVGTELIFAKNKNAKFGVSGTLQPTYIIQDRAFLISTDYKNYAEIPWLIRRWNVNTSLEAFVNYSTGNIKWQIGPQIRYQLLSSFQNKYPVKENLYDFGLKVGIMLKN